MTWLLALIGWGGAAAIAAALVLGMVISRKALLIAAAVIALALAAWGWAGYRAADQARAERDKVVQALSERTDERNKALAERKLALDAAEACSRSVAALADEADKRHAAAAPARQQAAQRASQARQRADAILATPAAVPGDDAASARQRAWDWLKTRKEAQQ